MGVTPNQMPLPAKTGLFALPNDGAPLIDRTVIARLAQFDRPDKPPFANEIWTVFLAASPGYMADLMSAVECGDRSRTVTMAHRLKGAAANVGAEAIRLAAANLEAFVRDLEIDTAPQVLISMRSEVAKLQGIVDASATEWRRQISG